MVRLPAGVRPVDDGYNRFVRRAQRGVWEKLFRELAQRGRSTGTQMIDSTHIKARRSASGARNAKIHAIVEAKGRLLSIPPERRRGARLSACPPSGPPRSTVQGYYRWRDDGTWRWLNARLVMQARQALGRKVEPSAGIIDSQSAPTTESGGPRGVDAGKRIKGRKRHIVTDTQGFLLVAQVHEANIQDPHGAVPLLRALRRAFPKLRHIFADRVYRGPQLRAAIDDCGPWTLEIVERPPGVKGFLLLPRRWVVERTFAWLGRSRRLAKDFEATIASATAWLPIAHIRLLARRLARA